MANGSSSITLGFSLSAINALKDQADIDYAVTPPDEVTAELIWSDSDPSEGIGVKVNGLSDGWDQYTTPFQSDKQISIYERLIPWNHVYEQAEAGWCMMSINEADETVVEIGTMRTWVWLATDEWVLLGSIQDPEGTHYPSQGDAFPSQNGCDGTFFEDDRNAFPTYNPKRGVSPEGFGLYKPKHSWWWHGYNGGIDPVPSTVKAVLVQQFARLKIENSIDDRTDAKYAFNVGCDIKDLDWTTYGEIGFGKVKAVTNDWQSFSLFCFGNETITKQEFLDSNPPFSLVP